MKDFSTSETGSAKLQVSTDEDGRRDEAFRVSCRWWIAITQRLLERQRSSLGGRISKMRRGSSRCEQLTSRWAM